MSDRKRIVGIGGLMLISAALVIVGLLFKIQHWEYASTVITIGLAAEALFMVLLGIVIFRSASHYFFSDNANKS